MKANNSIGYNHKLNIINYSTNAYEICLTMYNLNAVNQIQVYSKLVKYSIVKYDQIIYNQLYSIIYKLSLFVFVTAVSAPYSGGSDRLLLETMIQVHHSTGTGSTGI
jgi:hypothetical protein